MKALEQEIAAARDRLAGTIDQLAYRTNPRTIVNGEVAKVKAFFIDPTTGAPNTDNIVKVVGGLVGALVVIRLVRKAVN